MIDKGSFVELNTEFTDVFFNGLIGQFREAIIDFSLSFILLKLKARLVRTPVSVISSSVERNAGSVEGGHRLIHVVVKRDSESLVIVKHFGGVEASKSVIHLVNVGSSISLLLHFVIANNGTDQKKGGKTTDDTSADLKFLILSQVVGHVDLR